MPKYLITWGMHGHVEMADVVEAETLKKAQLEANDKAEDLWESNKIATAKPFEDRDDNVENGLNPEGISHRAGNSPVPGVHAAGRGSGDGSVTP
jgi:hypothetical protein